MARFQVSFDKSLALGWSWSAGSCGNDFCIGLPSVCHNEICSTSGERSHRQIRVGLTKRYQIPIRLRLIKLRLSVVAVNQVAVDQVGSWNGHPRPCFSTILKIGTVSQADTCRPREKIPNPDTACRAKRYQIPERSSSPVFFNDFEDWNGLTGRYVSASRKDTKSWNGLPAKRYRPACEKIPNPGTIILARVFQRFCENEPGPAASTSKCGLGTRDCFREHVFQQFFRFFPLVGSLVEGKFTSLSVLRSRHFLKIC